MFDISLSELLLSLIVALLLLNPREIIYAASFCLKQYKSSKYSLEVACKKFFYDGSNKINKIYKIDRRIRYVEGEGKEIHIRQPVSSFNRGSIGRINNKQKSRLENQD